MRKRPQALHRTEPISSRRQSGVVEVVQFWHTGCTFPFSRSAYEAISRVAGLISKVIVEKVAIRFWGEVKDAGGITLVGIRKATHWNVSLAACGSCGR